jgi:methionyl-tRNA synthetase
MGDIQSSAAFKQYIERIENWKSNIKGQCNSWLNEGLQPRAMTRDLDWGVPVPLPNAEGKVLYVWFDAPIGYISATKEYLQQAGRINELDSYWNNEETALIHFIGKDNIVFHAIIFPMMLMTHGNYNLPVNIPANEFLNLEGDKISTSKNWAVWLHEYLTDLPDRQDELRYVLTSISPETKDAEFTWKDYQTRINSELVSIFGNFVNRVAVLCQKFYEGNVPSITTTQNELVSKALNVMLTDVQTSVDSMESNLDVFKIRDAQADWMNIARAGNKFLAETEPWKLIKTDPDAVQAIMFESIQLCAKLAVGANVFLPKTAQKLSEMFGVSALSWQSIKEHSLVQPGQKLGNPEILFKPVEDETVLVQVQKLNEKRTVTKVETTTEILPAKPEISFDDFAKIDLRVGLVIAAEKVPKADKLLKLTVDLGFETRTILSGIAEHYTPEMILGKQVTVVVNLAPRKIRGIESQGMLLMAGNGKQLVSIIPEQGIDPGSEIK